MQALNVVQILWSGAFRISTRPQCACCWVRTPRRGRRRFPN